MANITLKTMKRATTVSRSKIRKAVAAAYAQPLNEIKATPAVIPITNNASPKVRIAKRK